MSIEVNPKLCTGCKLCERACPFGAIKVKNKIAEVDASCTLCGACANACPFGAIQIERKIKEVDLSEYTGIWAFVEQHDGKIKPVSLEILSEGRRLGDKLGQELSAVLLGHNVGHLTQTLTFYGADKIYLVETEELKTYTTDAYTNVVTGIISKYKPSIVLFGATHIGRDLAPCIANRIHTGLTADCTGLDIDEKGQLIQTRPAFGGNIMASIICPSARPQMATVRPNVMKKVEPNTARKAKVELIKAKIDPKGIRTKTLEVVKIVSGFADLAESDIIVAGGFGLGKAENFKIVEELAEVLGGVVGASRKVVDAGWKPHQQQIGQTGRTVSPKLYIACGISGAIQHMVGMQNSERIIAINNDPNAAIFKVADIKIVGDLFEIVPAITGHLRKLISS